MGMNPAESLLPDETHAVLSGALRELEGVEARLEGWAAGDTFTSFGKRLVARYEPGESMTTAMAHDTETILAAIGRALATLHSLPIAPTRTLFPNAILEDIRPKVRDLCVRFPSEAGSLESALEALERDAPSFPS